MKNIDNNSKYLDKSIDSVLKYVYPIHEQPFTFTVTQNKFFVQTESRSHGDITRNEFDIRKNNKIRKSF